MSANEPFFATDNVTGESYFAGDVVGRRIVVRALGPGSREGWIDVSLIDAVALAVSILTRFGSDDTVERIERARGAIAEMQEISRLCESVECRCVATLIVHWPGRTIRMCDEHAGRARLAAEALGFELSTTPIEVSR